MGYHIIKPGFIESFDRVLLHTLFNHENNSAKYCDLGFSNESNELQETSVACSEFSSCDRVELDLPEPSDFRSGLPVARRPSPRGKWRTCLLLPRPLAAGPAPPLTARPAS